MFKIFEMIRNKILPPTYHVTSIEDRLNDKNFSKGENLRSKLSDESIKKEKNE